MHITWSATAVDGAKRGNTNTNFWGECASSTGELVYAAPGHHDVRQDLAHLPELISEAQCRFCESLKQQNIPGSHISLQFFRHYASTLTPEMLSPMFWCREADEEKILLESLNEACLPLWCFQTAVEHFRGFAQHENQLTNRGLCAWAECSCGRMLHKARYGLKAIGTFVSVVSV